MARAPIGLARRRAPRSGQTSTSRSPDKPTRSDRSARRPPSAGSQQLDELAELLGPALLVAGPMRLEPEARLAQSERGSPVRAGIEPPFDQGRGLGAAWV